MIRIREAEATDAAAIKAVFERTYGEDYTYPYFYDEQKLRKLIFTADTLMLVADEDRELLGTGSVMLESGAYSDLVGEFGRLAVLPQAWGRGIGSRLLQERVRRVSDRLHVGFMEARITHPSSVESALGQGFAPLGFMPMKLRFGDRREHTALLVRYFGDALELRRNHPRIVPEVHRLADAAMARAGVQPDYIVDESAAPYPHGGEFAVQELTDSGYSSLLRIERGRVRRREIFGPMRLHYGFFKLRARHSNYLIARRGDSIAGAIGFTVDRHEENVRVFELICLDEAAIRFLLLELERRCRVELATRCLEIDVSAYAPRMQRTLVELGYLAAAYVPAQAFHRVERLDVVKMLRLLVPLERGEVDLVSPAGEIARLVLDAFEQREVLPRIGALATQAGLFTGLSEEQAQRVAGLCRTTTFAAGEHIFGEGEDGLENYLVLSGEIAIEVGEQAERLGTVGPGECVGEVALLTGGPHSASATALKPVEVAVMTRADLAGLVRARPDIGVVIYRNLARGLGEKLRRADLSRAAPR